MSTISKQIDVEIIFTKSEYFDDVRIYTTPSVENYTSIFFKENLPQIWGCENGSQKNRSTTGSGISVIYG